MDNKNELVDIIKYLLGYILKENDTLKKENKELQKKVAAHDAEESIIKMASNKLLEMFGEEITDDDENEPDLLKIKKKLDA
jgi:cell division septum initiation protein DivIVA